MLGAANVTEDAKYGDGSSTFSMRHLRRVLLGAAARITERYDLKPEGTSRN